MLLSTVDTHLYNTTEDDKDGTKLINVDLNEYCPFNFF